MKKREATFNLKRFLMANIVPIIFILLSAFAIPISQFSAPYLVQEMLIRLARDSFLVLSLLVPIIAGMGLNFGMVLGAMAGQIGLILVSDWKVMGLPGMTLAADHRNSIGCRLGMDVRCHTKPRQRTGDGHFLYSGLLRETACTNWSCCTSLVH